MKKHRNPPQEPTTATTRRNLKALLHLVFIFACTARLILIEILTPKRSVGGLGGSGEWGVRVRGGWGGITLGP